MRDKRDQIFDALKGTDPGIFALAFVLFISALLVASLRFKFLIDIQNIPATFYEALSLTFIGYFFNNFLPTAIGGDVVKAYYLSKKSDDKIAAYTSVFVDRLLGLVTMIFMAFLALVFTGSRITDPVIRYTIYAITAASLAAIVFVSNKNFAKKLSFLLIFVKPIENKIKKAYNAIHDYKAHKILIAWSLAISFISQLLFFLSLGIIALSIGSRISISEILLRVPLISALSLLPSINGLGLREGATVMLFGPIIGKENAFAVGILWLVILFMGSLIGGLIYGLSPQFKVNLKEIK